MRLDSIKLTNYRCHKELLVDFKPSFNVIVGINGSGKTSLLKGICEALSGLQGSNHLSTGVFSPLGDAEIARLKVEQIEGRYRFEPQFPIEVEAWGYAYGVECNWKIRKASQIAHVAHTGQTPGVIPLSGGNSISEATQGEPISPLIAFYRANRYWSHSDVNEVRSVTERFSKGHGYSRWWDASVDAAALQTWVIARCLERFQRSSETGVRFDDIQDDELALVNLALASGVEGIKGLKFDIKKTSLLVEWRGDDRDPTAFENLSDGQRAAIGLVLDIARRMCLLNPHLGQQAVTSTPGVVLIDELDIHLHPKWQRQITVGLKAAFPALQFIVASHSPQVLGELHPEEIILLRPGGTDHPQVSYGLDSNSILDEIMGASPRSASVDNKLRELFKTLERNEFSAARSKLDELKELAPGITELAGAEALLKRKEVLGR